MSNNNIHESLPDYDQLENSLAVERKAIFKSHEISEDDGIVRSLETAQNVFEFIKEVQSSFHELFTEYPSLKYIFEKEFISYREFLSRDYIYDICFLYECLFPEKDMFYLGQGLNIEPNILARNKSSLIEWLGETKRKHEETQKLLLENFNFDIKFSELECNCLNCQSAYRAKFRDRLYSDNKELIEKRAEEITQQFSTSPETVSNSYYEMNKEIEKSLFRSKNKLKRSTVNRMERQLKDHIKRVFHYPSELARLQSEQLKPMLLNYLKENDIAEDVLEEEDLQKFFRQLSSNLWRRETYITREFQKFINSLLMLKRKDVSSKILNEYLGEFWIHSNARQIKRKIIYHMGPTNSGKTYHAIEALAEAKTGCYLAPLRLLAGELYDTLNAKDVSTTLLTGEEVIEVDGATHFSSTIEMAKLNDPFDCVVIDEIQMITDPQRGWAWTRALVNVMCPEVHICGDPSVFELVKQITELCGDELIVKNYERMTSLDVQDSPIKVSDLVRGDALIVFSRRNALKYKRDLEKIGLKVSIVYGRLSPDVRREQARKFDEGETDIIVSTDAISMGMNLPIRRIVFSTLSKFINSQEHLISDSEIKQIAGRAGRYKRFPNGYATCLEKVEDGIDQIKSALTGQLPQKEKCMVGPDLDIYRQVINALESNSLPTLKLSEFLRLFYTMNFIKPFFCVELKEMIEISEMVEEVDFSGKLLNSEVFGFTCAPVNLGLVDHVQYFVYILNNYVENRSIKNETIKHDSNDIDYLETSIKCVELYQWLSRHFNDKNFDYDPYEIAHNKQQAVEQLNDLLSKKIVPTCSSCGTKLSDDSKFAICEECFKSRRFTRRGSKFSGNRRRSDKIKSKKKSKGKGRTFKPNKPDSNSDDNKPGSKKKSKRRRPNKNFKKGPPKKT